MWIGIEKMHVGGEGAQGAGKALLVQIPDGTSSMIRAISVGSQLILLL